MDGRLNTTHFTLVDSGPKTGMDAASTSSGKESGKHVSHGGNDFCGFGGLRSLRSRGGSAKSGKLKARSRASMNASRMKGRSGHGATAGSGSLLLLSVCTAAFMMLFILQIIRTDYAPDALAVMRSVMNDSDKDDDEHADDTLGKLQLVQLPSILEVFAPSNAPIPPLAMNNAVVDEDSLTAKIYAQKGTAVASVLAGTVKSVVPGGELGGCVVVAHDDDIEVYYYGLGEIMVERGQPVMQNSTIGLLAGDTLYLRVTKEGRPIDPFDFLGIKAEIGG